MTLIYLLLFAAPQLLLYLYLRERLPLTARRPLALLFVVFNIPWVIVAVRMFSGSLWGISRTPYIAPWIAWQLLGWIFCGLVAVYILGKAVRRLGGWAVGSTNSNKSGAITSLIAPTSTTTRPSERISRTTPTFPCPVLTRSPTLRFCEPPNRPTAEPPVFSIASSTIRLASLAVASVTAARA